MNAAVRTQYGPPELLSIQAVPSPTPGAKELLLRVHACTVNRTDCGILWGEPFIIRFFSGLTHPKHPTPGTDFAGEVVEVGSEVTKFSPGDKVWGFDDNGLQSQAEYLVVSEDKPLSLMPEGFGFEEMAASSEGAHYARNFLNKVRLTPGQKVMLNGGTGAIGSAALQFLKAEGLYVVATCRGEHAELVKGMGADRIIDYTREDFTQDAEVYDFVFDAVGKSTFGACKRLLVPGGVYISSELGPHAQNPFLAIWTSLFGGKKVKFPVPVDIPASLAYVKGLMEAGKFKPLMDRSYPLAELAAAYRYVRSGQKVGNVIIRTQEAPSTSTP